MQEMRKLEKVKEEQVPSIITNGTLMPKWGNLETFQHSLIELLYNPPTKEGKDRLYHIE